MKEIVARFAEKPSGQVESAPARDPPGAFFRLTSVPHVILHIHIALELPAVVFDLTSACLRE